MVNRTQALVLGFLPVAVTSLLVILAAALEVYDQALRLPTGNRMAAEGPRWYVSFRSLWLSG